jgi:TetR/AcrR family transcriptional regulator, transcriptional repressor of bet genes
MSEPVELPINKPKFSREEPEARRKLLIEATVRCLSEQGRTGITVENICNEAGVSRGLLNHYFDGKEDLIVQAYLLVSESFSKESKRILSDEKSKPYDKLKSLIEVSFQPPIFSEEHVIAWLGLCNLVRTDKRLKELDQRLYNRYRFNITNTLADLAEERGLHINAARVALGLTAIIDGLWLQWSLDQNAFVPQEAQVTCLDYIHQVFSMK